jgi:hypothetical protein
MIRPSRTRDPLLRLTRKALPRVQSALHTSCTLCTRGPGVHVCTPTGWVHTAHEPRPRAHTLHTKQP